MAGFLSDTERCEHTTEVVGLVEVEGQRFEGWKCRCNLIDEKACITYCCPFKVLDTFAIQMCHIWNESGRQYTLEDHNCTFREEDWRNLVVNDLADSPDGGGVFVDSMVVKELVTSIIDSVILIE